jgi:DNA primase
MKHFNDLLRRVKKEFDWDSYVKEHHTVKYTPSDELRICCFVCGDTKFKLYVNPVKKTFCCFKCDFSMKNFDVFDFVSLTEGISRHQATVQLVHEYARVTPSDEEWAEQVRTGATTDETPYKALTELKTIDSLPAGLKPLLERTEESAPWWDYLIGRGITPQEIRALGTHYTPAAELPVFDSNHKRRGDLASRVVFPVYGGSHQLVSWQGRTIDPDYPGSDRYLMCPESDISKTLWPFVKPYGKHVVLVEGIFDCLAVRRIPDVSAYATFTKKVSIDQMLRLRAWGVEEVTLFWDKRDAKPEMVRAVPELHMNFKKAYVCRMTDWPDKLDAGNMLADSAGADKLKKALEDRVDTYDALEFAKWRLSF